LLKEISSSEITEWIAYLNLKNEWEPVDPKTELTKMFSGKIKKKAK
jgi:hypothetical protein